MNRSSKFPFSFISILLFSAGILLSSFATGQKCEDRLEDARILYEQGNFQLVIDTLSECGASQDNDIMLNTHRLRAMAYLALNEPELARIEAIELLKADPVYQPSILNHQTEFVRLINGITVLPKFSFGISFSVGTNLTIPRVENVYSVIEHSSKIYRWKQGFLFGISGLYQLNNVLGIKMGLLVNSNKYEIDYPGENLQLKLKETLMYGKIPISLRYSPGFHTGIRPFIQIGLSNSILLGSSSSYYSEHLWYEESNQLERINASDRRNKFVFSADVGVGAVKHVGAALISLEINYQRSMRYANKGSTRFNSPTLSDTYFHLDDDFYLDNVSVVLGYAIILNYKVLEK